MVERKVSRWHHFRLYSGISSFGILKKLFTLGHVTSDFERRLLTKATCVCVGTFERPCVHVILSFVPPSEPRMWCQPGMRYCFWDEIIGKCVRRSEIRVFVYGSIVFLWCVKGGLYSKVNRQNPNPVVNIIGPAVYSMESWQFSSYGGLRSCIIHAAINNSPWWHYQ